MIYHGGFNALSVGRKDLIETPMVLFQIWNSGVRRAYNKPGLRERQESVRGARGNSPGKNETEKFHVHHHHPRQRIHRVPW